MNGDPVEVIAENLEALEDTLNVIKRAEPVPDSVSPANRQCKNCGAVLSSEMELCWNCRPEAVPVQVALVSDGQWQQHPEAYFPRVVVYVREKKAYFELLKDGQAVGPWATSPEGRGFEFWIIDTDRMADLGMSRCG